MSDYCKCAVCVFWERKGTQEGLCRRHAPLPSHAVDEVAHWPETYADSGCAEGAPAGPGPVICQDCALWKSQTGGIIPQRKHGETIEYWRHAGHCFRFAPLPSPELGARGYRRVTRASDSCGDGKPLS
ncbi:MAG TPA: hypothetical protein VKV77_03360 [Methylovirgula sp.]|nr:hypothetical protein [Methylovirgula sp.]